MCIHRPIAASTQLLHHGIRQHRGRPQHPGHHVPCREDIVRPAAVREMVRNVQNGWGKRWPSCSTASAGQGADTNNLTTMYPVGIPICQTDSCQAVSQNSEEWWGQRLEEIGRAKWEGRWCNLGSTLPSGQSMKLEKENACQSTLVCRTHLE